MHATPEDGVSATEILAVHFELGTESIQQLRVGLLARSPFQPRSLVTVDESLYALADSIRIHGVLEPILVRATDTGDLQLLAGERRLEACKLAGLETIPVRIKRGLSDLDALAMALTENIARADLCALDEAHALHRLHSLRAQRGEPNDVRALAKSVGRGKTHVAEMLLIAERLGPSVVAAARAAGADVRLEQYPKSALMRIAKVVDPMARTELLIRQMTKAPPRGRVPPYDVRGAASSKLSIRIHQPVSTLRIPDAITLLRAVQQLAEDLRAVIDRSTDMISAE
jgi:ParB family chromosome partitioning protein